MAAVAEALANAVIEAVKLVIGFGVLVGLLFVVAGVVNRRDPRR